ncbi:fasciclin-like arabinogalactan protein 12 [Prosopis cineraria]|uniref:fasciclin-like arabinogalactan protein 12 n=1 Tax=Prosopis cineraria TaxID=364024 RepID=UPI0024103E13|nr:fasciclin-like arabinogalactan protein 12 [Prosopis cineraria]
MTVQIILAFVLIIVTFYCSTTLAQLSPVQAPATAPPASALPVSTPTATPSTPPAAAPGLNTVPQVPVSPGGAPKPAIIPKAPAIDIVQILRKAKIFSVLIRLLKTTQLINQLNSQLMTSGAGGLTIFAPEDSAFSKLKPGFLNSLNDRQKVELLQFHTISSFISISNFDTLTNPVQTQAGDDPKRLQLNVTTYSGNQVSMTTGAVNATLTGTVYTDNKLAIYQVDKVLLPLDIMLPKALAPAPAKAPGDSPKAAKTKSSSVDESSGDDNNDKNDNVGTMEASSGSVNFNAEMILQVPIVLGVVFFGGAMI